MNKTAIKNFAVWARRKLISEITYKAGLIGINENGISSPLENSTDNIEFYDIGTGKPTEISGIEVKQRQALVVHIKEKESTSDYKTSFQFVVEEVAYTWFNRLVAIRFMEVNDYLPSNIRVLSSEMNGKAEPDMVTTPFETDMEFSSYERDRILQLKDENKLDELFRMLFIKQCNKLNEVLPELFERTNDYTELLLNISFTDKDGIVSHLVNDIDEDDFKEAVEIIGWLYQFYNTEPKSDVDKQTSKISKEQLPAATQLFTPDWIVRYMMENSLGRLWLEGHPNSDLKLNWKYYLDEAKQEENVQTELEKIREEYKNITPEAIKLIDPCMGSGHILVYAFDVLMQIYESLGYTQRDAAQSIIENNIYGLDIDERAYQLAYFALMMKARQYDRRFLTRKIFPQVYCPKDYTEGQEFGSLLNVDTLERKPQEPEELTIFNLGWEKDINTWNFRRLLNQKYDVVITNPPYKGSKYLNDTLNKYIKKNYPDSKADLFAVFIERCLELVKIQGYISMVTMHAWMFLTSYDKLRGNLLNVDIINMAHLGARGFEEISGEVVQTTSFVMRKSNIKNYKATFSRLVDYSSQQEKENAFFVKKDLFTARKENFSKIPGSPIAYWVSEKMYSSFNNKQLSFYADAKKGISTSDNEKYLKLWHEVGIKNIGFNCKNSEEALSSFAKWFPLNKGGTFRKWYGNNDYIINWHKDGVELKNFKLACIRNEKYYFGESLTWTDLSSYKPSFRYNKCGFIHDVAGPCIFNLKNINYYLLGLLNTVIAENIFKITSPTMHFNIGTTSEFPTIINEISKHKIDKFVEQNISLSKVDWDSFETSWDFEKHPLVQLCHGVTINEGKEVAFIEDSYNEWEFDCNERFNTLKSNEEELNRIFIDIYGLQDELTPEVEDKDVTVRKADLTRDIKLFVSYAVGCMFGRYSLDVDGLAFAGGDWEDSKYKTFIPDQDNCIPITDETYFEDDIVGLFVGFVKRVYGAETLEENLDFIAKALGNKGKTSREIIRNYFVKDFYKDHVKTYQKRPIYWLYDSGKQDGFKALIYMHRYNADTTGLVRVDYLHKMQKTYVIEIDRMQDEIENGKTVIDVSKAEKRKEKLLKQLKETKEYDEKIAHLALSRISIDLDDGVKINYEKVQTDQDGKKLDILGKI